MRSRNFAAEIRLAIAPAATDTEFTVTHGLPTLPRGYRIVKRNKNASLYLSGTTWTSSLAYFKSDVANAQFYVLFFG